MGAPVIRGQVNVSSSRAAGLQPKSVKENLFHVDSNYFVKIIKHDHICPKILPVSRSGQSHE